MANRKTNAELEKELTEKETEIIKLREIIGAIAGLVSYPCQVSIAKIKSLSNNVIGK